MESSELQKAPAEHGLRGQEKAAVSPERVNDQSVGPLDRVLGGASGDGENGNGARLLLSSSLSHSANGSVRALAFMRAQQTHGNRLAQRVVAGIQRKSAATRFLQRECSCGGTCEHCPVEAADVRGASAYTNGRSDYFAAGKYAHGTSEGQRLLADRGMALQPKLNIGEANDTYEQEADRMADRIIRMPDSREAIQRKSSAGEPADPVESSGEESITLAEDAEIPAATAQLKVAKGAAQRTSENNAADRGHSSSHLEERLNNSKGSGAALSKETRTSFEPAFRADFSQVHIHTGADAIEMTEALNAKAFTHGTDIYFNAGQYDPASGEGRHLLAHELTHTVQQGGSPLKTSSHAGHSRRDYLRSDAPDIQAAWYNFDIPFTDYQFDPSIKGIKTAAGTVKDVAVEVFEWIVDKIKGLVSSGIQWLTDKWKSIQEFASKAFDAAKNFFTGIIGFMKSPLSFIANAIMTFDAQSVARAWATFSGLVSSLSNNFKALTDNLFQQVNRIWGTINGFATSLLDKVTSLTESFVFKKLPDALQRIAFAVINQLKSLWKGINDGWNTLFNKIKGWVESALDTVLKFVKRVLSFGINVVVDGIIQFGKLVLFLKDLFSNPQKYVDILSNKTVQAFDGVESRFAGIVGQYFGNVKQAAPAIATHAIIRRQPASDVVPEAKRSATWSEIGSGIWEMMGKKWSEFKSNPSSVVTQLLLDMILPIVGNIKDVIQLFTDIKKIVTGPLSAGSLEELWTSFLKILDIPILIYHTIVSILMRTLMVPLIVASFIPHPLVKGIAAAVGLGLLGAFVQAEVANIGLKLLLLKTGATTKDEKKDAYNCVADSLIALAMTAVIVVIMLVLHFIANVMKGVYNFIKGKVFGFEATPVEGKGGVGEGKAGEGGEAADSKTLPEAESKKGVAAERSAADGHKIKIMEDGRIFICTTCEELHFKYREEIKGSEDFQNKLADAEGTADSEAKADKVEALQKKLAEARQKKLAAEPSEIKGKLLAEMRATARKVIGEIANRLKQREVIDTLRESPEIKAEIENDLRNLLREMAEVDKGAEGVEGDPELEDAAREEYDTIRAKGEALKEKIENEINPPAGSAIPRPDLKYPKNMLPNGGKHPYVSPGPDEVVQAAGEKPGYLDKDDNVWQVDRTKARTQRFFEWDVQTPDGGHINVGSDGNVTH